MKILNNVVGNGKTGMWVKCILYVHVGIDVLLWLQCMLAPVLVPNSLLPTCFTKCMLAIND